MKKLLLTLALIGLLIPSISFGVVFDNVSTMSGSSVGGFTLSHTATSTTNKIIVVSVLVQRNEANFTSSVDYGGVALTRLVEVSDGSKNTLWYGATTLSGANDVHVYGNGVNNPVTKIAAYTLADANPVISNYSTTANTSVSITISPTSTDSIFLDSIESSDSFGGLSVSAGQTLTHNIAGSGITYYGSRKQATSTPVTMSWSGNNGGFDMAHIVAEIQDYTAPVTPPGPTRRIKGVGISH